jgi:hypothetical protein
MRIARALVLIAPLSFACTTGVLLTIDADRAVVADHVLVTAQTPLGPLARSLPEDPTSEAPLTWPVSLVASFPPDVDRVTFSVAGLRNTIAVARGTSSEIAIQKNAIVPAEARLDPLGDSDGGVVGGDYFTNVLADTPLGYYHLGEATGTVAADATGRLQNGTYGAAVQRHEASLLADTLAVADGAALFPGGLATAIQTVRCNPTTSTALLPTTALSVELWFEQTSGNAEGAVLVSYDYATPKLVPVYSLTLASNHVAFFVHTGQTMAQETLLSATTVMSNHVYHVVATYDAVKGEMHLWVDGADDASSTTNSGIIGHGNSTSGLGIGGTHNDAGVPGFSGTLDEVAIYGAVLSADRVRAHYLSGTAQ